MPAHRQIALLLLLQTRGTLTAAAIAEELGVSIRTAHRDIDQLSAAGVPVYADRGRGGGFRLLGGYRTQLTGLTHAEAEALLLAGLPGPAVDLGLADPLAAVRLKLLAALPSELQVDAERVASRFHLDPSGWFSEPGSPAILPTVARAVWNSRYLRVTYARESGMHTRKLGPLGIVLKGGIWYLVAQHGERRLTYRASNILQAEVLDEPFAWPVGFDLAAYWSRASREYERSVYHNQALLRVSPRGWSRLEFLGSHAMAMARASAQPPDRHGWVRCTIPVEAPDFSARELLRLGDEAEVLEPPALRAALQRLLRALARRYRLRSAPRRTRNSV